MNDDNKQGILLESGTNEVEFLRFSCSGQKYGINVAKVCQVMLLKDQKVNPLAGSPAAIDGATYFRDHPITVINLRKLMSLGESSVPFEKQLLLVTEFNNYRCGLVVDTVDSIVRISWNKFVPLAEAAVFDCRSSCVVGTITVEDTIILVLDIETLVASVIPSVSVTAYVDKIKATECHDRASVNILCCEDSPMLMKLLIKSLSDAGFAKIHSCANGSEGLNYLNSPDREPVDIILSDIEMPMMDGLTLCKRTRELQDFKKVPFIFFSSMINEQMKQKCLSVGGNAAFSKPEVHTLVAAIEEFITNGI